MCSNPSLSTAFSSGGKLWDLLSTRFSPAFKHVNNSAMKENRKNVKDYITILQHMDIELLQMRPLLIGQIASVGIVKTESKIKLNISKIKCVQMLILRDGIFGSVPSSKLPLFLLQF